MTPNAELWRPEPRRIAVFRALALGDMLCAVPALRALRAHAPRAHITLIGLPWARDFVHRFRHYVNELLPFPGFPGMAEQAPDITALPRFFEEAQRSEFDLAIQLHGSGTMSNFIVTLLGAKQQAGFCQGGGYLPESRYFMPWPEQVPEIARYLELMRFLGVPMQGDKLEFPLVPEDLEELKALFNTHGLESQRYVCLHPGARLPSRRWSAERFGAVARALADQGYRVVLTGSAGEKPLAREVAQHAPGAVDLVGHTSLGAFAALITASKLLVCNDTGVSHVAAAVGTPSVVIACGSSVERWAPLDRQRHHVLSHSIECRPCEHYACPIGHVCAEGVSIDTVVYEAVTLLRQGARP